MRDLFHALLLVWEYIDSDFQRPQDRRRFARELASDFGRTSRGRYSGTALMRMMLALAQRLIYCFRAADSGLSVLLFEEPAGGLTRFSGYFGQWTDVIYVTIDNDWVTCSSAERSTLVSKVTERLSCGKMISPGCIISVFIPKRPNGWNNNIGPVGLLIGLSQGVGSALAQQV